jgi:hypothetical protein
MFILMQSMVNDDEGTMESKKTDRQRPVLLVGTYGLKRISSLCVPYLSCENNALMVS